MIQLRKLKRLFFKEDLGAVLKRTADWMEKFSVASAAFYFLQESKEISLEKALLITFGFLFGSYVLTLLERRMK